MRHVLAHLRQAHQTTRWGWRRPAALLALVLALGGCGRAEQSAQQPSPVPLAPATLEAIAPPTPVLIRPTPDQTQHSATLTVAYIKTGIAANRSAVRATATAKAAWAQTPEPTILPPADSPRLRDRWPTGAQQATPSTHLYLRSVSHLAFDPDLFWEVRLSDTQTRRLPAVEQNSIDQSAQVSPDGRFLAYVTGNADMMERTLRVFDLTRDTDLGLAISVTDSVPGCSRPFAWSLDGRGLAAITVSESDSGPMAHLQLYDDISASLRSRTVVKLPYFLDLIGWMDANHLLLSQWKPSTRPNQLLSVDRQGGVVVLAELPAERLSCAYLSPDGQDLIYTAGRRVKRLRLRTGQEEAFPWKPDELFWVGDGRTLLVSRFGTDRRVWLYSLDQSQNQAQGQSGMLLSPPYQAAFEFGIIGVSPDNRLLVACERAPTDNPRIRTRASWTWLYSITDDRWSVIRTNPEGICDMVVGWGSSGGGQ